MKIILPKAHSDIQQVIYNFFLNETCQELVVCCGTKFGKTLASSVSLARVLPLNQGHLFRWIAPYYSQSRIGQKYIKRLLPPNEIDARLNPPIISMPKIDTTVQFYHGTDPETLEGEGVKGQVLDEAAKLKEEVYISAFTTTTQTRGKNLIISTPRGKNWFYKKAMEAKEEQHRAKFEGRPPKQMFLTAPTSANPYVPKESIEDARKRLPANLFRQYYLAEFIEDGDVFNSIRKCIYGNTIELYGSDLEQWQHPSASEAEVVIGADWAKTEDRTVFVAFDVKTRHCIGFMRFYKRTYTEAIRLLVQFSKRFKTCLSVFHDKTGVGQAIEDQLAYTQLNYRGITFTNATKTDMVNRLVTATEQQLVFFPNWQPFIAEFESFEVKTNKLGTMTYSAPSGQHDDIVCAAMLGHTALLEFSEGEDAMVRFLDELPKDKTLSTPSTIEEYYTQMIGDFDDDDN